MQSINALDAPDLEEFSRQVLMADWACYAAEADRADFPRLRRVIREFPQGFRLYLHDNESVGYTGWYPIAAAVFDQLYNAPETLTHRGQIMPVAGGDYLYFFNYSIRADFHKTEASRKILAELAGIIHATPHKGLAAVTVSPDGIRVAERFGMSYRGDMTHDGDIESVYALRL